MDLNTLTQQLNQINTQRVKFQTLAEQAKNQCKEIEEKYNVTSLEELTMLKQKAQESYDKTCQEAQDYLTENKNVIAQYEGLI